MRICSPQLGIAPNSTLGGEVYDREVLIQLAKLGNDIEILLPNQKPFDKSIKNFHVDFAAIKIIFPAYLYSFVMLPYLFNKYRQTKFDLLRIHVHFLAFGALIFNLFHPKVPIIAHYHLDEDGFIFNIVNKFFLPKCDLVIADSFYLKQKIINKFGLENKKVKVVHCGTDLNIKPGPKDQQIQKKYNLKNKTVFMYMGRLIPRKRPDFLTEVFHEVHEKNPDTSLLIFGRGPLEREIREKVKRYSLEDSVFLLGTTFGKEKIRFYNSSNVFVFPSVNEGFVLVILEALAAGLPIIASKAVSFTESVEDGKNGYLIDPNNKSAWVKKMLELANNIELCRQMGKKSRALAIKEFSWENTAKQIINFYNKVVNE